jgi:hypothetical protein
MERERASGRLKVRQLELAWAGRISWEELAAEVRLQLRNELARLLRQVADVGAGEVGGDDAEC